MAGRKNKRITVEQRRYGVAKKYLTGTTMHELAKEYGVNVSQISRDMKAIRKMWLESSLRDFDELKAQSLAKIDRLEREAWEAWERSKFKKTNQKKRQGSNIGGKFIESSCELVDKEEQIAGDPRFLNAVMDCIRKRGEILGQDAPIKIQSKDMPATEEECLAILSKMEEQRRGG